MTATPVERRRATFWRDKLPSEGCFFAILLCIFAVYTVLTFLVPLAIDDYMYILRWNKATGHADFSFEAWMRLIKENRWTDNFRIGNMFAPFAVMFSPYKEIYPVFIGLGMTGIALINTLFADRSGKFPCLSLLLIWAMMILFLPWENIFTAIYSLNYIFAALITLLFLFFLFRTMERPNEVMPFIAALVSGIVAGGWHEGFALPTIAGLVFLTILRKGKLPLKFYIVFAFYIASTVFFVSSPGISSRISYTVGSFHFPASVWIWLPVLILITLVVANLFTAGGRDFLRNSFRVPIMSAGVAIIIAGYLLGMITDNTLRCYFWANDLCIIMSVRMAAGMFASRTAKKPAAVAAVALWTLCMAQSAAAIGLQYKIRKENDTLMSLYKASETGIVFHDIQIPEELPWFYRDMPVYASWRQPWQYYLLREYYEKPFSSVVPEWLKNASVEEAEPVASSPFLHSIPDGLISKPHLEQLEYTGLPFLVEERTIRFTFADGTVRDESVIVFPFLSLKETSRETPPQSHSASNDADTLLYYKIKLPPLQHVRKIEIL